MKLMQGHIFSSLLFFLTIVSSSSFFLKVLLLGVLKYQGDSMLLPTDLTPNEIMYFRQHAYVYFPTVSLGDGYLRNTSRDKILLFLNNLHKLLACHRITLKGRGEQVPNKAKCLYLCILRADTRLRVDESCVAAGRVRAMGMPSTDPDEGGRAGTGGAGY